MTTSGTGGGDARAVAVTTDAGPAAPRMSGGRAGPRALGSPVVVHMAGLDGAGVATMTDTRVSVGTPGPNLTCLPTPGHSHPPGPSGSPGPSLAPHPNLRAPLWASLLHAPPLRSPRKTSSFIPRPAHCPALRLGPALDRDLALGLDASLGGTRPPPHHPSASLHSLLQYWILSQSWDWFGLRCWVVFFFFFFLLMKTPCPQIWRLMYAQNSGSSWFRFLGKFFCYSLDLVFYFSVVKVTDRLPCVNWHITSSEANLIGCFLFLQDFCTRKAKSCRSAS